MIIEAPRYDFNLSKPSSIPVSLNQLPDDVLLRIIHLTGTHADQVGIAYKLGAVSSRLRHLLKTRFLTSITALSPDRLESLSLADASAARAALTSMFSHTSAVKVLNFSGCSPDLLSVESMKALARSARHSLTTINLAYCCVTDDVVRPVLRCPNLRSLILPSCNGVTGAMFADGQLIAPLEVLDLSYIHSFTRDGVRAVATITTLKHVKLKGCDVVNSNTLRAFTLSDVRLSLKSICLAYCPVMDKALYDLLDNAPNLRTLSLAEVAGNLWSTGDFTAEGIVELRASFPNVTIQFST